MGQLLGSLERGVREGASCSENGETRKDEGASKIFDECQTLTLGEKPPRQVTGGGRWKVPMGLGLDRRKRAPSPAGFILMRKEVLVTLFLERWVKQRSTHVAFLRIE